MFDRPDPHVLRVFRTFTRVGMIASILLGLAVLAGWRLGWLGLETVSPGLPAMSPLTAAGFVVAGTALCAQQAGRTPLARIAASLLLLLSLVVLVSDAVAGGDLLSPMLVHRLGLLPADEPAAMAPASATSFMLLALSLLAGTAPLRDRPGRTIRALADGCAATGLLVNGLVLLGYAYGVEGVYAVAFYRAVALHTALGLFVLFLVCLAREPDRGWAALLVSGRPSGEASRVQLVLATLLPFLIGLLVLRAQRGGAIEAGLGVAIIVVSTMIPLVLRILRDGRILHDMETRARLAVAAREQLTGQLEDRVRERTESLALSEARLRTYFDNAPEGLVLFRITGDGRFVVDAVSPSLRVMYGLDDGGLAGGVTDDIQTQVAHCRETGQPHRYLARRPVGGIARLFDVVLAPVAEIGPMGDRFVVGSVRDITDLEAREEQLRQSQKMEAVGQLTGGIAHDFNNLLTGIGGSLELMTARLAQGRTGELGRYIEAAQIASRRAAALTHRLLAFSRRQTLDAVPTDVGAVLGGMEELIRRTVGPSIAVEAVGGADLWTALIDANQLENALLNLCLNARDAMPDGGRLGIVAENVVLPEAAMRELEPGEFVRLRVSDTGVGMTAAVAARAFDPFFTTKPLGQGTGLGLSMIYGFVRQSGGAVAITSEPGHGTAVAIYLPRYLAGSEPAPSSDPGPNAPAGLAIEAGQGAMVLVVDDEATVRVVVVEALEELGYRTIQAEDAAGALALLRSDARIDLLLTDVGLPGGLNGRQLADAAQAMRRHLKVLLITGYAEHAVLGERDLDPGMQVLTKPFPIGRLGDRVRALIEA